jgi:hypothetical protein
VRVEIGERHGEREEHEEHEEALLVVGQISEPEIFYRGGRTSTKFF